MNILNNWKLSIIILVVCSVLYIPLMKKLVQTLLPQTIIFYVTLIVLIGFTFINIKDNSFKINIKELLLIMSVGILAIIINYMTLSTIKILPNAGYIRIVNTLSLLITVLVCVIVFKDEFTIQKIIGTLLCTIGAILIFI